MIILEESKINCIIYFIQFLQKVHLHILIQPNNIK